MKKIKLLIMGISIFITGEVLADCGCGATKEYCMENAGNIYEQDLEICRENPDTYTSCMLDAGANQLINEGACKIVYAACKIDCALKEALGKAK